jgi:LuxR family maltose regulon positive regulatory protein
VETLDPNFSTHNRFRMFGLSAVSNARGYAAMATGEFAKALEHLSVGRKLSERADATFTLAYSRAKTGLTFIAQGHLQEAIIHLRSAMSDPRMYLEDSVSKISLVCALVMALYESNETDEALEQFRQYSNLIAGSALHDYIAICYRAVARIHDNKGDRVGALKVLEEAERCAYAGQWPRVVELVNWERVRFELIAGYPDRALSIANAIPARSVVGNAVWIPISEDGEDPCIGKIRLSIYGGHYAVAVDAIQHPLRVAVSQQRIFRQIKLLILLATSYQGLGDKKQALHNTYMAISLAAPGGYLRSFLDEGGVAIQLLKDFLHDQTTVLSSLQDTQAIEFVRKLLRSAGEKEPEANYFVGSALVASPACSRVPLSEELTKKEVRILKMIAGYLSNEQIATQLFVSRETVKYHVKNIYAKLGVKSRLEAISLVLKSGISDH